MEQAILQRWEADKVFDRTLSTTADRLVRAIYWAAGAGARRRWAAVRAPAGGRVLRARRRDRWGIPLLVTSVAYDDNDGVLDAADNCPAVANADQADLDGDGQGDPGEAGQDPGEHALEVDITLDEHLIVPEVLVMSKAAWDKLSTEDQELVRQAAKDSVLRKGVLDGLSLPVLYVVALLCVAVLEPANAE